MTDLAAAPYSRRPYLSLPGEAWRTPLVYMLTLAALGLYFYPALLLLMVLWARAWKSDRYALLIQLTLFFGGYGMLDITMFPVWTADIAFLLSLVLWVIYRKPPLLRRAMILIGLYVVMLLVFACLSRESMKVQLLIMRNYFGIAYIIVPFALFSGIEFDIRTFFMRLAPYVFLMCAFYISDSAIIPGNILVPATATWADATSTFWDPIFFGFGHIERKYPPGMLFVALMWLPVVRWYRLKWWQWALIILGLGVTRTFSIISGFLAAFILFQNNKHRIWQYCIGGVAFLFLLWGIDCLIPVTQDPDSPTERSALRIKSTFDQFTALSEAIDDEDLAQFASGRMAQILPKVELMQRMHKTDTGLGFLHPEKTIINDFIIFNEYYSDESAAEEVAAAVEVTQVQTFIHIGWIGLILQLLFFVALYVLIRKYRYRAYYVCVLFMMGWFGIGGFGGWISYSSLFIISIAFAVAVLGGKTETKQSPQPVIAD